MSHALASNLILSYVFFTLYFSQIVKWSVKLDENEWLVTYTVTFFNSLRYRFQESNSESCCAKTGLNPVRQWIVVEPMVLYMKSCCSSGHFYYDLWRLLRESGGSEIFPRYPTMEHVLWRSAHSCFSPIIHIFFNYDELVEIIIVLFG